MMMMNWNRNWNRNRKNQQRQQQQRKLTSSSWWLWWPSSSAAAAAATSASAADDTAAVSFLRQQPKTKNESRVVVIATVWYCFLFISILYILITFQFVSTLSSSDEDHHQNHHQNHHLFLRSSSSSSLLRSFPKSSSLSNDQSSLSLSSSFGDIFHQRRNTTINNINKNFPFPIHTSLSSKSSSSSSTWEDIDHPGILFSKGGIQRIEQITGGGMNVSSTIHVPKFWNTLPKTETNENNNVRTGGGFQSFLGNDGLPDPQLISQFGSTIQLQQVQQSSSNTHKEEIVEELELETIFISIASYRDSIECQNTVVSIYERAQYPERIRIGIVDQINVMEGDIPCIPKDLDSLCNDDENDKHSSNPILCRYTHLIDVYDQLSAQQSIGPIFARHIGYRMYRGEYYVLQIDSHVRFVTNWDTIIIQQWKSTQNEMAILTTYLTDLVDSIDPITHTSLRNTRNMMCYLTYEDGPTTTIHNNDEAHLILQRPYTDIPKIKSSPMLHPFWSAGFSFGRGHFIVQVPYDQYLPMMFQGEEANIAIRSFTYGYDFYAPSSSVAFHMFAIKSNIKRRYTRHKYWENKVLYDTNCLHESLLRLNTIIGIPNTNINSYNAAASDSVGSNNNELLLYQNEIEKYSIGRIRSKELYYQTFGINPILKTIIQPKPPNDNNHHYVDLCDFVKESMHLQFTKALRTNHMGIDYTQI